MSDFSPETYLKHSPEFEEFEILEKLEGHNNLNFIFKSKKKKYVLRKRNKISPNEKVLKQERTVLNFLEGKKLSSAPKSINFDEEQQVHIITYVGKENINIENLDNKRLIEWTKRLTKIHKYQFQEFKEFCEKENLSFTKPETPKENIKDLKKDLNILKEDQDQENLIKFCQEKIKSLEDKCKISATDKAYLNHSDISNSTRTSGNEFYFIDWEYAYFKYNKLTDLAILFVHRDLTENQKKLIKETYKQNIEVPKYFEEKLTQLKNMRIIFDIIWSVKRIRKLEDKAEKQKMKNFAHHQKQKFTET